LEQFAYVASHDLREPLRSVTSFSQLLSRKINGQADEETHQYLTFINNGAARMERLIADLLAYSRVGTHGGTFKEVNLNNAVKDALQNLSVAISEAKAKITVPNLSQIKGDETQLIQLFQNLLANAIKFRPKDKIPQIKISSRLLKDKYEFSVSDNGIGIPEDQRERIFMIFQRLHTSEEYQGTGIGLAVCKKIVERHGGKIRCTSSPEGGTTFVFSLKINNKTLN
jgi:light-regulated signal transduction histidine kinase (bacteriophytochrome)